MKKALVTGGCGFVGSSLVRKLLADGYEATVLDDFSSGVRGNVSAHQSLSIISGTLDSRQDLRAALSQTTEVVHLAARAFVPDSFVAPDLFRRVNVEGSRKLLEECANADVRRVVLASSAEVYGPGLERPLVEQDQLRPVSPYAETKLEMERMAAAFHRDHGLPTVVLRLFNSFGPRAGQPYVVPEIIRQAAAGSTVSLGDIDSKRDLTYVDEISAGIIKALEVDGVVGEIINLGSGRTTAVSELVSQIGSIFERPLNVVEDRTRLRETDIPCLEANCDKAASFLGWGSKLSLREGLRKTITWYLEHGREWSYEKRSVALPAP